MDYSIIFPHLGIFLEHVGKSFSIGGFSIAYYGVCIAIGMLAGLFICLRRAKETGQSEDAYTDLFIFLMIFGIVGARIYYVAFSFDSYKDHLIDVFNLRQGGLAIYGGIIGGVITILVFSRIKGMHAGQVLDTVIMGVAAGQIIGRWGNFFNREAFGEYTDNFLAMQLPVSAVRPGEITQLMKMHEAVVDGVTYIQVHPTFLYEGLWNTALLVVLFLTRKKSAFRGEIFCRYLIGYGIGRALIEGLRTDQLLVPGTSFPVSQGLSIVLAAGALLFILIMRKRSAKAS